MPPVDDVEEVADVEDADDDVPEAEVDVEDPPPVGRGGSGNPEDDDEALADVEDVDAGAAGDDVATLVEDAVGLGDVVVPGVAPVASGAPPPPRPAPPTLPEPGSTPPAPPAKSPSAPEADRPSAAPEGSRGLDRR